MREGACQGMDLKGERDYVISTALQNNAQRTCLGRQQAHQHDRRGTNVVAIVRHTERIESAPVLNDAWS